LQRYLARFPPFAGGSLTVLSSLRRRKTTFRKFFPHGKQKIFSGYRIASHQLPDGINSSDQDRLAIK
jgi:hypothetical protein